MICNILFTLVKNKIKKKYKTFYCILFLAFFGYLILYFLIGNIILLISNFDTILFFYTFLNQKGIKKKDKKRKLKQKEKKNPEIEAELLPYQHNLRDTVKDISNNIFTNN